MTDHDRVRKERAEQCDLNDLDSVAFAVVGLQSTDDPSLVGLHDMLMDRWRELNSVFCKCVERGTRCVNLRAVGDRCVAHAQQQENP